MPFIVDNRRMVAFKDFPGRETQPKALPRQSGLAKQNEEEETVSRRGLRGRSCDKAAAFGACLPQAGAAAEPRSGADAAFDRACAQHLSSVPAKAVSPSLRDSATALQRLRVLAASRSGRRRRPRDHHERQGRSPPGPPNGSPIRRARREPQRGVAGRTKKRNASLRVARILFSQYPSFSQYRGVCQGICQV